MMKVNTTLVNITSEDPGRLLAFYRDVVGSPAKPEMGDAAMDIGGATLGIDGHSMVRGAAKEPQRVLIDLFVDDLMTEQRRLENLGVTFVRTAGREYWGGVISTLLDPDGNYIQLIEYKPEVGAK